MVVAGTHGKTTTTALTAHALRKLETDPGYLVGGVPLDLPSGNETGASNPPLSSRGTNTTPPSSTNEQIHSLPPRILVLNNLEFDHGDIFRDLEDVSRSFTHLCESFLRTDTSFATG